MTAHSTIGRLDNLEDQYTNRNGQFQHLQQTINSWDQTWDKKLEIKINHLEKMLDEKFICVIVSGIHAEYHGNAQHSKPHQEKNFSL